MKIKILNRNPRDYLRETTSDIHQEPRNYDPELHPFQQSREYVRALNAAKLGRVFAKPFMGALDGHRDGVYCMAKHPSQLSSILSGAYDGEVRLWRLSEKRCVAQVQAHEGYVRGICVDRTGSSFVTVGDDKTIKRWALQSLVEGQTDHFDEPVQTLFSSNIVLDVTQNWGTDQFATCGDGGEVQVWDAERSTPVRHFRWGADTIQKIRFNPVETNVLAATAVDRSITLYDCREQVPLRKLTMKLRNNAISWNPMEAYHFTVANEDYNLYTFDMRRLKAASMVHKGHTLAVMDVDYSPTGREFVSGSYDKTIRIFPCSHGRSREVYHTKRMQIVMCVLYTYDNKYVLCGSDEMNIRIWKAKAAQKLGPLHRREKIANEYADKLTEKYGAHPAIRRIVNHRQVSRTVHYATKEIRLMTESRKRKETNRRKTAKPGTEEPILTEKEKPVLKIDT